MSASVFKPIYLPNQTQFRSLPEKKYISRVKRVLFEPIDHEETQKFLERELAKHTTNEKNKWDFDFTNELPLNQTNARYVWKPVIPSVDKMTYAPKRRRSLTLEDEDNSALYPQPLTEDQRPHANPLTCIIVQQPTNVEEVQSNKKQCKITDFMQARKRPIDSGYKKIIAAPRPSKISRDSTSHS